MTQSILLTVENIKEYFDTYLISATIIMVVLKPGTSITWNKDFGSPALSSKKGDEDVTYTFPLTTEVKYLHQLKNLYLGIIGNELKPRNNA